MYRLAVFISFILFSANTLACSCAEQPPSVHFGNASNVLNGRIMKLEILFDKENRPYQKITLDNKSMLKGNYTKVIYSAMDVNACHGMSFSLGKEYVAFTDDSNWITGYCGGTQLIWANLDFSKEFLKSIRALSPNKQINKD